MAKIYGQLEPATQGEPLAYANALQDTVDGVNKMQSTINAEAVAGIKKAIKIAKAAL